MKISVVTISYNQARFLQKCIDSVAAQSGDWEHIIVDPGSTDGSREIIETNRSHFSHVVFEKDDGPADGLRKGFALATGTHGFFINSDDFMLPNAFAALANLVAVHPQADVFLCGGWIVDEEGRPSRRIKPTRVSLGSLLDGSAVMFQQGMLFSMSAYRGVGGFNIDNRICWDFELLCDLIHNDYQVVRSARRIGAFRVYPGAISDPVGTKYNMALRAELKKMVVKLGRRDNIDKFRSNMSYLKRHLLNPWLIGERAEKTLLRRRFHQIWANDIEGEFPVVTDNRGS